MSFFWKLSKDRFADKSFLEELQMEKYQGLAELTEKYLYGKLSKLILEYNTPTDLHVSIQYEDENDYWFDYDLEINKDNKYVDFLEKIHTNWEDNQCAATKDL